MRVTHGNHCVTAVKVKIFCSVGVENVAALAADDFDIEQRINVEKFHNLFVLKC